MLAEGGSSLQDGTSRVMGDCHARICEELGVKSPGLLGVRHEQKSRRQTALLRNCITDEGRPLGVVLQERIPNYLPLLQTKSVVVSREGKGPARIGSSDTQEEERK